MVLQLAAPQDEYYVRWDGDEWYDDTVEAARLGLYECGREAVQAMKDDEGVPYLTGALKDSLRTAPPGYDQDDTPLVQRAGSGGDFFDLGPFSPDQGSGMAAYRAARAASGSGGTVPTSSAREQVLYDGTALHLWVGSFVFYAYWIHQGFYHVRAARNIAGRAYITPFAERYLGNFEQYFKVEWPRVRYGGA